MTEVGVVDGAHRERTRELDRFLCLRRTADRARPDLRVGGADPHIELFTGVGPAEPLPT